MLYLIIPPILVVLSLTGLIIFLTKKAPQVALLEDRKGEEEIGPLGSERKKGFLEKIFSRSENGEKSHLKHGFLFFLEKFTRKLRIFFLKLENLFTHWSESLKRKRKNQAEPGESMDITNEDFPPEPETEIKRESDIVDRIRIYESAKNVHPNSTAEIRVRQEEAETHERMTKPMISDKLVVPRSKPEIKNRLERILIERIAANPKDVEAYERLGEYYFEIENFQHSKECFKQVIKLDPINASVKDKMRKLERLLARR